MPARKGVDARAPVTITPRVATGKEKKPESIKENVSEKKIKQVGS